MTTTKQVMRIQFYKLELIRFISFRGFIILLWSVFCAEAPSGFAQITLQEHQKKPVQYLAKHPEINGLLLFHALGSGKTFIALDYAEKNIDKNVVVLVPNFLKSNWVTQMKAFGIKNESRYQLISFDELDLFLKTDLSNTILVVDEVHKIVQKIRLGSKEVSENFIKIYGKIREANKVLLLSGTPIFVDTSDIAYIANLIEPNATYPIDPIKFKTEYMSIKPVNSLVRGHLLESKFMISFVPMFATFMAVVTLGTAAPFAVPLVALAGSAVIPIANEFFPAESVSFRSFDPDKWGSFVSKYVSFYDIQKTDHKDYPSVEMHEEKVLYNESQVDFFLSFVDEDLSLSQLKLLLREEDSSTDQPVVYNDTYLMIHSSQLQKHLLQNSGAGREIGNLDFLSSKNEKNVNQIVDPPKFHAVFERIQKTQGQVAVYSSYFFNGIKKFSEYLDRKNFQDHYQVLLPWQTSEEQARIVDQYNTGKKRILLIHPEITEGISLVGTQQFHILEPVGNPTLLHQIIGRAVRYQSHIHLPSLQRTVHVYLWESNIEYSHLLGLIPTGSGYIRREHWQKKYSEVNPSAWTKGIVDLDSAYFLKNETPDQRVKRHQKSILKDLENFKALLLNKSIEFSN